MEVQWIKLHLKLRLPIMLSLAGFSLGVPFINILLVCWPLLVLPLSVKHQGT